MKRHDRYSEKGFAFGNDVNDFLGSIQFDSPKGNLISLAEDEGRNAVYMADLGFDVTAVDLSEVELEKAEALTEERGVKITTVQADLGNYTIKENSLDGAIIMFGHFPDKIRRHIHNEVVKGLKPGGFLIIEAYDKAQINYSTSGPDDPSILYASDELVEDFGDQLDYEIRRQVERPVLEGRYHSGLGAVNQIYAIKSGIKDYKIHELVSSLDLKAHPEGGYYKETYRSKESFKPDYLEKGSRNVSTAIYFLIHDNDFSSFHRIKQDEMWHHYEGQTLLIHVIDEDGNYNIIKLSKNFEEGEMSQAMVPAGSWFASEVEFNKGYSLVGCTVAPGFDFQDFELAKKKELSQEFPNHIDIIGKLTRK